MNRLNKQKSICLDKSMRFILILIYTIGVTFASTNLVLSEGDTNKITNTMLCNLATKNGRWNSYNPQYVWEAKQRGLSCGLKESKPLLSVTGNWMGVIKCNENNYPFFGTFYEESGRQRMNFKTDDVEYVGVYEINQFQKLLKLIGTGTNGQRFNEVVKLSNNGRSFSGRTSNGCIGEGSKISDKPSKIVQRQFNKSDFLALTQTERKQVQYALKKIGLYTSVIDGLYGPKTEMAARKYAKVKGIQNGYPNSLYSSLVSEVNVPSSFASLKKPTNTPNKSTEPKSDSNTVKAIAKGIFAIGLCSGASDPTACLSGIVGNKPDTSNGQSGDVFSSNNSCTRDGNCSYNEFCAKKPGMTRGECMEKPSGVGRNWSPQGCTRDSQCSVGGRCDRTYKICVER